MEPLRTKKSAALLRQIFFWEGVDLCMGVWECPCLLFQTYTYTHDECDVERCNRTVFFFCEIHILDWELSGHSLIDLYQVVGILGSLGRFQVMAIPLWWMTLCACGSMAMAVPGR